MLNFFIKNNFPSALASFKQAQECSKGKLLNTDDRLELRIWQSQCHEAQGQLDQAILTLSKVINDDAISSLRLKAMYLRAEIYKKQHRYELARKQFEALAKKSGEWALKAQEALKNHD